MGHLGGVGWERVEGGWGLGWGGWSGCWVGEVDEWVSIRAFGGLRLGGVAHLRL